MLVQNIIRDLLGLMAQSTEILSISRSFADITILTQAICIKWLKAGEDTAKGWRRIDDPQEPIFVRSYEYILVAPDGTIHRMSNMAEFARQEGLVREMLHALCKGKTKKYRGWKLYNPDASEEIEPEYKLISPDGTTHSFTKFAVFAKECGLDASHISDVLHGKRKSHKGWVLHPSDTQVTEYKIVDPDGNIHTFTNIYAFARQHGLSVSNLRSVLKHRRINHKGWRLP
jgi:hypothetical protein